MFDIWNNCPPDTCRPKLASEIGWVATFFTVAISVFGVGRTPGSPLSVALPVQSVPPEPMEYVLPGRDRGSPVGKAEAAGMQ